MRGSSAGWPVRVAGLGQAAAGSALWRIEGQLMATVIVKATFAFVPNGVAAPVAPEPIRVADEHDGGNPMRSLVGARDTAPQLHKVDVVLVGHAHAPAGASETAVRLCLRGERGPLLDKSLHVYGDRQPGGAAAPFTRIRLGWERALGGIGFADNPIGTGVGGATTPPNVIDPTDAQRPGGLGPIPSTFPARKRLLGGVARSAIEGRVAEIPRGLDWSYFQCAPPDQRLAALRGDEWLLLEGLTARQPDLRTRLPGLRAVTRVYGWSGGLDNVALVLDTLHVDADAERFSLSWRGSLPLASEQQAAELVVACALEAPGALTSWPSEAAIAEVAGPLAAAPSAPERDENALFGTVALDAASIGAKAATPFGAPRANAPPAESPFESTVGLSGTQLEAVRKREATPFGSKPRAPSSERPAADIPGAPWAAAPAKSVPQVENNLASTAFVPDESYLAAKRKLEEQERQAAEKRRAAEAAEAEKKAEAERARQEAEQRRRLESERFAAEQEAARREEERRAGELAEEKKKAAQELRSQMYGGLKRKK